MKTIEFCNKMRSRERVPILYFVNQENKAVRFDGKSIPKVCVVMSDHYRKNGKWSGSEFEIAVSDDWTPVIICEPFEGFKDAEASISSLINEMCSAEITTDQLAAIISVSPEVDSWDDKMTRLRRTYDRAVANEKLLATLK